MEIRSYIDEDEEAVVALWLEAFPENPAWNDPKTDIRRKLKIQRDLFLVAIIDSNLIGTAMAGYDGHRGWVHYVAVKPEYRRQGIGEALMKRIEHGLKRIGCPKLNLQVRADNDEAAAFYKKLGYKVEPRISMAKLLE
jgi:ribosomal protein S18 acetylase RimI-like enzyme